MSKAQCKNCGDTIESVHRHDFVTCSCFQMGLDHGFYLDGGHDYIRCGGNFDDIIWIEPNDGDLDNAKPR